VLQQSVAPAPTHSPPAVGLRIAFFCGFLGYLLSHGHVGVDVKKRLVALTHLGDNHLEAARVCLCVCVCVCVRACVYE